MYMQGFPLDYDFLQGIQTTAGGVNPYPGLSTNQAWVNNFQNPFNKNTLTPAAAQGQTDPAGAYAMLAPAFAQIKNDAINFVASYPVSMQTMAQNTINGWKNDWPLIQGFLDRWATAAPSAIVAAPAGSMQPTTILQDQAQPNVYSSPSIFQPSAPSVSNTPFYPASSPANVNVTTAPAGDLSSTLTEYLPWVAVAVGLGLLLNAGGRRS